MNTTRSNTADKSVLLVPPLLSTPEANHFRVHISVQDYIDEKWPFVG
jgi:hypothetical protein